MLLDPRGDLAGTVAPWSDRVDRFGRTGRADRGAVAAEPMLVRPDGHVCWVGVSESLRPSLARWFGAPVSG